MDQLKNFENVDGLSSNLIVAVYDKHWWLGKEVQTSNGPSPKYSWGDAHETCFEPADSMFGIMASELLLAVGTSSRSFQIEDDLVKEISLRFSQCNYGFNLHF